MKSIALLGEFDPAFAPHQATNAAIEHSCSVLGIDVRGIWVPSQNIDATVLTRFAGIWVAPGGLHRDVEKTLRAIRYAREQAVPCLGTCGGFQHMVLEYARNALGYADAQHAQYDRDAKNLFIAPLACSLAGREMPLRFVAGSRIAQLYGSESANEQYYCSFGINPDKVSSLKSGSLAVSGADAEGEVRVIELPLHPFFIGTLFVPQARSRPGHPHPVVTGFLRAVAGDAPVSR